MHRPPLQARLHQLASVPPQEVMADLESLFSFYEPGAEAACLTLLDLSDRALADEAKLVRNRLKPWVQVLGEIPPTRVFRLIYAIEQSLKAALLDAAREGDGELELLSSLRLLEQKYETFVREKTLTSAADTGSAGRRLLDHLRIQRSLLNLLKTPDPFSFESRRGVGELSLGFPYVDATLHEVAGKLEAIEELYGELAVLGGISTADHPLRVGSVESGSLWVRVFGESRIIGLLVKLIESTVAFLYRRFTSEGEAAARVKDIERLLDLQRRMKEEGLDVEPLNEELVKSSRLVARRLNQLLEGEPAVVVNDVTHALGEAAAGRLLVSRTGRGLLPPAADLD